MEIEREDYREPNRTKPLMEMFTEWHTEGSRNYRRTACRTECRATLPEFYQMTTEKPTDNLPKLPTEMATEKSTKNAPKSKKNSLQTKLKPNRIMCRITDFDYNPESRLYCYQATKAIDNRYDELVDGATNFQNGRDSHVYIIKSYRQVESLARGSLPRHAPTSEPRSRPRSLLRVDPDSTEAAYPERNHEVDRMVTEADFERWLPSQCRLPMTTGCKIYSIELAEAQR